LCVSHLLLRFVFSSFLSVSPCPLRVLHSFPTRRSSDLPDRARAATKFLLYSLLGGLVMLVALIGLYVAGPGGEDGFLLENLTGRSEEHTSELQSRFDLVCRLLLEKKNKSS